MTRAIPLVLAIIITLITTITIQQPLLIPGIVKGRIINEKGEPLSDVRIEFYSGSVLARVVTVPSNGVFTIKMLPGTYLMKIFKEGYATKSYYIRVEPNKETLLGDIVLENALRVSMIPTSITLEASQSIQLPFSVINKGEIPLQCNLEINTNSSKINVEVKYSGVAISSFVIGPSEVKTLSLCITAPYKPGNYFINVTILPSQGLPVSFNITVKVKGFNTEFLTTNYLAKIYVPGDTAVFNLYLKNPLSSTAIINFNIKGPNGWQIYLISPSGEKIESIMLSAGQTTNLKLECKIPEDEKGGTYNIYLNCSLYNEEYNITLNSSLTLKVIIEEARPEVKVRIDTPILNAYSGGTATFEVVLMNTGTKDAIIDLSIANLSSNYVYRFHDAKGNVISSVYLSVGSTKKIYIDIRVPYGENPKLQMFDFIAKVRGGKTIIVPLGVNVLGKYAIDYETEVFSLEMPIGGTLPFQIVVKNTGANELTNVRLVLVKVPSEFNVTVNPTNVDVLTPGSTCTFTLTISSSSELSAGDYYITIKVVSDQAETLMRDIRVTLYQRSEMVYIAFAVLIIVFIFIVFIYHKYGRR